MYNKCCFFLLLTMLYFIAAPAVGQTSGSSKSAEDSTLLENVQSKEKCSLYLKQSIVPAVLATSSLSIMAVPGLKTQIQDRLNWNASEQANLYDDELRYVPLGAVALLSLAGVKGENKILEEIALGGISYILADFIVYRTKQATQITRPNPLYGNTSFPSQHASMAFVGATLLHREFGHISPWISISGYGMATWVAYARIARNRHFLPDVLMGSAVGILSTNATYWAYEALAPKLKKKLGLSSRITESGGEVVLFCSF